MDAEEIDILVQALEEFKAKAERLEEENHAANKRIAELNDSLAAKDILEAENLLLIQELEESICVIDKELAHANDQLADVEQECAALKRKYGQNTSSKQSELDSTPPSNHANNLTSTFELHIGDISLTPDRRSVHGLSDQTNALEDLVALRNELSAVKSDNADKDKLIAQLQRRVEELERDVDERDRIIQMYKSSASSASARVKAQVSIGNGDGDAADDTHESASCRSSIVSDYRAKSTTPTPTSSSPGESRSFENYLDWKRSTAQNEVARKDWLRASMFTPGAVDFGIAGSSCSNEMSDDAFFDTTSTPTTNAKGSHSLSRIFGRSNSGPTTATEIEDTRKLTDSRRNNGRIGMPPLSRSGSESRSVGSSRSGSRSGSFSGSENNDGTEAMTTSQSTTLVGGILRTFLQPKSRGMQSSSSSSSKMSMPTVSPPRALVQTRRRHSNPIRSSSPASESSPLTPTRAVRALNCTVSDDECSPNVSPSMVRFRRQSRSTAAIHDVEHSPERSVWLAAARVVSASNSQTSYTSVTTSSSSKLNRSNSPDAKSQSARIGDDLDPGGDNIDGQDDTATTKYSSRPMLDKLAVIDGNDCSQNGIARVKPPELRRLLPDPGPSVVTNLPRLTTPATSRQVFGEGEEVTDVVGGVAKPSPIGHRSSTVSPASANSSKSGGISTSTSDLQTVGSKFIAPGKVASSVGEPGSSSFFNGLSSITGSTKMKRTIHPS